MVDKLLTKKDLATRWQVQPQTIDDYVKQGVITPVKGIPSIRFNPQHIAKIEQTEISRFSPFERRKLQEQLDKVTQERDYYKSIVADVDLLVSKVRVQQLKEAAL